MLTAQTSEAPATPRAQGYAALALLSLGAGFLHAAVINAHDGHGIASAVFTWTAIFQVAWAGLLLARPCTAGLALMGLALAGVIVPAATAGAEHGHGEEAAAGHDDGHTGHDN